MNDRLRMALITGIVTQKIGAMSLTLQSLIAFSSADKQPPAMPKISTTFICNNKIIRLIYQQTSYIDK